MKMLSSEVKSILDKLYNLRGEDSVILAKMTKERQEAIETQERTKNEKEVLLEKIAKLTQEEDTLAKEGKSLSTALGNLRKSDFETVLERLNISFDPEDIKTKVDTMLPDTIAKVVEEHQKTNEQLKTIESEMNNAITKVEELGIRKDEALSNQAKLNDYFQMALDGNINITRDAITSLLQKFNFTEDEQREAAKLLMFPEDALYEYDASLKSTKHEERIESKVEVPKVEEKKEEVVSTTEINEVKKSSEEESRLENIFEQVIEENIGSVIEEPRKVEEKPVVSEPPKIEETPAEAIKKLDLPVLSNKDMNLLVEGFDKELIENNLQVLKEKKIDINIINGNAKLLLDKELKEKLERLLNIGKEVSDINMMPYVLVKYDLQGLDNTINALKISGLDPKKVPLMAY